MKYYKILFLSSIIFLTLIIGINTEFYYNNPQLFLVRLNYKDNFQLYDLYDNTNKYKSYNLFVRDFNFIMKNKNVNKNMNFKKFKNEIKKYVFLNDILIKKNNETVQCEREYFYKVKYFIPTMNHEYIPDGFYIFLFVLFLIYKFENKENILKHINSELDKNKLNIRIDDISGNLFIKMRDVILTKEICYPEKIAGIRPDFIIENDSQKRTNRRNPFRDFPKVIELKIQNNKIYLTNVEDEYYLPRNRTKERKKRINEYINTPDFKRRLFINTTNTTNDIYMDKTLNNVLSFDELENELINSMNLFKNDFNNKLDCNSFTIDNYLDSNKYVYSNADFNNNRIFSDKIFTCGNGRILITLKTDEKKIGNTVDVNRLHYTLCPTSINGKLVGKMDYYNENCSINDIVPEAIFSKNSELTELPFNYWLFKDRE
jgi:hypothetical protein